jgi:hypothetical protein
MLAHQGGLIAIGEHRNFVPFPFIPVNVAGERTNRSPDRDKAPGYFDEIPPISRKVRSPCLPVPIERHSAVEENLVLGVFRWCQINPMHKISRDRQR